MASCGDDMRNLMCSNIFSEVKSFFATKEEAMTIARTMEQNIHGKARSKDEYFSLFMNHLNRLKELKQEANAQAPMDKMNTSLFTPISKNFATNFRSSQMDSFFPQQNKVKPPSNALFINNISENDNNSFHLGNFSASGSRPASYDRSMSQNQEPFLSQLQEPYAAIQAQRSHVIKYLTECDIYIHGCISKNNIDDNNKLTFFKLLLHEVRSVRTALESSTDVNDKNLAMRVKEVIEKLRGVSKATQSSRSGSNIVPPLSTTNTVKEHEFSSQHTAKTASKRAVSTTKVKAKSVMKRKRGKTASVPKSSLPHDAKLATISALPVNAALTMRKSGSPPVTSSNTKRALTTSSKSLKVKSEPSSPIDALFSEFAQRKVNKIKTSGVKIGEMLSFLTSNSGFENIIQASKNYHLSAKAEVRSDKEVTVKASTNVRAGVNPAARKRKCVQKNSAQLQLHKLQQQQQKIQTDELITDARNVQANDVEHQSSGNLNVQEMINLATEHVNKRQMSDVDSLRLQLQQKQEQNRMQEQELAAQLYRHETEQQQQQLARKQQQQQQQQMRSSSGSVTQTSSNASSDLDTTFNLGVSTNKGSVSTLSTPTASEELQLIRDSRLFKITVLASRNENWRVLRFDYEHQVVPILMVGLRHDYDSDDTQHMSKMDFRVQKGQSTLPEYNIKQIEQLLNRCLAQRRSRLYDLICTWHSVVKHVFGSSADSTADIK